MSYQISRRLICKLKEIFQIIADSQCYYRLKRRENTRKVPGKPDSFSVRMGSGRVDDPSTVNFPEVEWEEAFPESLGMDSAKLKLAIDYLAYRLADTGGLSEFVIIRSGYLIARGNDIDRKHNIWSVTKTFTGTALGLLIDDGTCSLDTFAKDYEPLLGEHYRAVKLRHFANMTSGYDAVGYRETHAHTSGRGDWGPDPYDPDTPLFAPGTKFCYHDEAVFMFGRILTVIARQTLYSFLKNRITDPVGIRSWVWPTEGKVNGTDINQGCTGIAMSANQLARWGYLFLNRGNWNGQQFISATWIDQAIQNQVPISLDFIVDKQRQVDGRGAYGFGWWMNGDGPDGIRKLPDAPNNMYWAAGFNNNMCFVIPDWNMVVVRLGTKGRPTDLYEIWNNFFDKLGRSVIREGSQQQGG